MSRELAALVPGDPASVSGLAVAVGAVTRRLQAAATSRPEPVDDPDRRVPRAERELARRLAGLGSAQEAAAAELATVGSALQGYAPDLAAARADARALAHRIDAAGFALSGTRVVPRPGIRGTADAGLERGDVDARSRLQAEVDGLVRSAARRRTALAKVLAASTDRMDAEAARRRRG